MTMIKFVGFFFSIAAIRGSPLSRVHMRFEQTPHIQEHTITTDAGRLIDQQSYFSLGRINYSPPTLRAGSSMREYYSRDLPAESIQYQQKQYIDRNALNFERPDTITPDFSNGLAYPDPLLLTGEAGFLAARRLYGHGELFYKEIPHERAILRNQREREDNGLYGNILSSHRPSSPWYRFAKVSSPTYEEFKKN